MDPAQSNHCCFCHKDFKSVGNHYKNCPERNGKDYQHLLSDKTLAKKRSEKTKKVPCPKCGKQFLRLETHLRNSAVCKSSYVPFQPQVSQLPSPQSQSPSSVSHPPDALTFVPPTSVSHPLDALTLYHPIMYLTL